MRSCEKFKKTDGFPKTVRTKVGELFSYKKEYISWRMGGCRESGITLFRA